MAVTGPIPLPKMGSDILADSSQNLLQRLMEGQQEARKLAETQAYHKALTDQAAQEFALKQANAPLQRELLKAKILEAQANAKRKNEPPKESAADIKNKIAMQNHVTELKNLKHYYEKMGEFLDEDPSLTGFEQAFRYNTNLPTKKNLGKFIELSTKAQGSLAKLIAGSKSGIGVINWTAKAKPNYVRPGAVNKENVAQNLEDIDEDLRNVNEQYKLTYGTDMPGMESNKKVWKIKNGKLVEG